MIRVIGGEYAHTNYNLLYPQRRAVTARNEIIRPLKNDTSSGALNQFVCQGD